MLEDGQFGGYTESPEPFRVRRFHVKNNHSRLSGRSKRIFERAFAHIYRFFLIVLVPLLALNFSVALFSLFNSYELLFLTKALIIAMALLILYKIFTIFPRFSIVKLFIKTINKYVGKDVEFLRSRKRRVMFLISSLIHFTGSLPGNINPNTVFYFNLPVITNILGHTFSILVAIFFLSKPELHFSFALLYDFSIMALFGIPDMLFSGLFTAIGISHDVIESLSRNDRILIGLINVSLFTTVVLEIVKVTHWMEKESYTVEGNYSEVCSELSLFPKPMRVDGIFQITDYGPIDNPIANPVIWYYSDVAQLSIAEVQWVTKNIDSLNKSKEEWEEYTKPRVDAMNMRGFKRIQGRDNAADGGHAYFNGIDVMFMYSSSPQLWFAPGIDYQSFTKLIIDLSSSRVELEDGESVRYPIPYEPVWPLKPLSKKKRVRGTTRCFLTTRGDIHSNEREIPCEVFTNNKDKGSGRQDS